VVVFHKDCAQFAPATSRRQRRLGERACRRRNRFFHYGQGDLAFDLCWSNVPVTISRPPMVLIQRDVSKNGSGLSFNVASQSNDREALLAADPVKVLLDDDASFLKWTIDDFMTRPPGSI
jgi:hypothetical protein